MHVRLQSQLLYIANKRVSLNNCVYQIFTRNNLSFFLFSLSHGVSWEQEHFDHWGHWFSSKEYVLDSMWDCFIFGECSFCNAYKANNYSKNDVWLQFWLRKYFGFNPTWRNSIYYYELLMKLMPKNASITRYLLL